MKFLMIIFLVLASLSCRKNSSPSSSQSEENSSFQGVVDNDYGIRGAKMDMFIGESWADDIVERSDHSIVVVGVAKYFTVNDYVSLMFYDDRGDLISSSENSGKLKTGLVGNGVQVRGAVVGSDDSIIVGSSLSHFTKIQPNNTIDSTFGENGVLNIELVGEGKTHKLKEMKASETDRFYAVFTVQSDNPALYDLGIAKLDMDGVFDTSFNATGYTIIPVGQDPYNVFLERLSDDSVIVGFASSDSISLYKVKSDGTLDVHFGDEGIVEVNIPSATSLSLASFASQGTQLLIYGESTQGDIWEPFVIRLTEEGTIDESFGDQGVYVFQYPDEYVFPTTMLVMEDSSILFAGGLEQQDGDTSDYFVVKLTQQGELDETFATDGLFVYDFLGDWDEVWALKELTSGKVLVGGYAHDGEKSSFGTVMLE